MKLSIQKIKQDNEPKFNGVHNPLNTERKSCCGDCKGKGSCNDAKRHKHLNSISDGIVSQ